MSHNPRAVKFLESAIYGKRKDPAAACARVALLGLSWLFRGLLWLYRLPLETGIRKQYHLERPVVSVGNITLGGTGKSPTVDYLCRGLCDRGFRPAVLSLGYGGLLRGKLGVVSDQSEIKLTPEMAGDEPVMHANALPGVPVVVGKSRHKSGQTAIQELGADILVLDDGFQIWQLYRDLDIVLIDANNPFDNGNTLPAGRLREPLGGVSRADCIIAVGDWETGDRNDMMAKVREHTEAPVFFGRFVPSAAVPLKSKTEKPVETIRGRKVFALSSIANPAAFEKTLADAGAVICGRERLPDHHQYWAEDVAWISRDAMESGAEFIVTTDKDAVKLEEHDLALPSYSLRIRLELADERGFWDFVEQILGFSNHA